MTEDQAGVVVSEVSMQEWAMLAFHAERAPQRVYITSRPAAEREMESDNVGGARTVFWLLLAGATALLAAKLLLV